ncbi:TetR/AcrR family transcriptional regulator [Paenibacillus alvei]|uniref:TetR/AcrR family transcriptional regulator n=1 Tax=Paenibacillus alvei TaxID=44250 RepID=UPI00228112CF|nr:TetR/AcrR family transcriptional regulator [Paenibacillus alvei]MCY7487917.1 TetR/AcrR family transcriptional regulator [Paenibacillus alvei]
MGMTNIPLRERKKAKIKVALYEACLDMSIEQSFRDMKVEEICARAEVSKVTFFKCFPKKEDVLVYYMCVWLTKRWLEIDEQGLQGWEAAKHLFACVAEDDRQRPGIMLRLVGLLAEEKMHPSMPLLSDAEISLLFPEKEQQAREIDPNLYILMKRIAEEAISKGEATERYSIKQMTEMLFTIFYGAYLTAHLMMRSHEIMACYMEHLEVLVK